MPVEAACPNCAGKFRLPDAAAGKRIRCPKCKGPLDVPPLDPSPAEAASAAAASTIPAKPAPEALKAAWRAAPQEPVSEAPRPEAPSLVPNSAQEAVRAEAKPAERGAFAVQAKSESKTAESKPATKPAPKPEPKATPKTEAKPAAKIQPKPDLPLTPKPAVERWFLRGEDGEVFGPVDKPTLDAWHDEGRMTADSQLLKDGTDQWQWASDLYPDLEEPEPAPTPLAPEPIPAGSSSIHRAEPEEDTAASRSSARSGRASSRSAATRTDEADTNPLTGERLSPHSKPVAFLLALTLGMFGIHRFYLGYVGIGLAMFFTFGGLLMWSLTDALRILFGHVTDSEGLKLRD